MTVVIHDHHKQMPDTTVTVISKQTIGQNLYVDEVDWL